MSSDIETVSKQNLEQITASLKQEGYRLVVVSCTPSGESYDITYTFDKDTHFKHLRINEPEDSEIPSITSVYPGSFVYENEIHDLYGFRFTHLSLDFGGTFIRTSVPYPFRKKSGETSPTVTKVKKEEP